MKHKNKSLAPLFFLILILTITLCGCFPPVENSEGEQGEMNTKFQMRATIQNLQNPFEVEVTKAEYASGIYWLVTSGDTVYEDTDGNRIQKDDLTVGDTVIITYNGQVMMSYPPQIVAVKIVKQ